MILRRATADDAQSIAVVHRTAMRVSLAFLPELHSAADDLRFFSERFLPANEVWVAEVDDEVVGYVGFHEAWINHLYVLPEFQGRGIGPALLDKALAYERPMQLWTFQQNTRARKFYEDRGFGLVKLTDGSGNEEKTPDALYEWRPPRRNRAEIDQDL
ncbi:MAG TPA: GNAT family N-acetyltransferase [Phenylobacterium sp.]